MITDADIKKLSKVFATKQDLNRYATKDEMKKGFARIEAKFDVKFNHLIANMATKKELHMNMRRSEEREREMTENFSRIMTTVDRLLIPLSDLRMEYAARSVQTSRHEEWHQQVAKKLNIKLQY